ncbi:alkylation response protein AidB-like acyl-CoA dehydrogenase [Microbacterium endophyticum]|uniref:Alkylation response protein AidB-like acyl-CoA dehydrogenase n=1 Tax=Microbacterium endophyticum TaxID=1526412 RepID=A0A7W4V516_9MICO|nr:acyl-CoA dehydrogenase [Microbacterium endophyticum]MBB2975249.1 alkylation response protein AidB-like acyl-CoA dehydrogenase [Microbacterium endophyticum]MBB2976950.1 alkylation response protein AidB-like acyl-CoA dehydrogenase [Microbacterium endophyticum]NIK35732.1 alkylation response protein AidB-like acyl-CoA dehydrogenase [Microbacterium endophyticum]
MLAPGARQSDHVASAIAAARGIHGFGRDVEATLHWCVDVINRSPRVGEGSTAEAWELLAATAEYDVSAARMLEPHLDALGILAQAQAGGISQRDDMAVLNAGEGSSWGVFAAEADGVRVDARETSRGWTLSGTKPWCSLAAHLSHALVTAYVGDGNRGLFAVDLREPGVQHHPGPWVARGLPDVVSAPVDFDGVPAVPVGNAGWYLSRSGFTWGAMSVAACWWGAAVGVAARLLDAARPAHSDQLALVHLGRVDAALWAARAVLSEAATLVDEGTSAGVGNRLLAERVRSVVADAAALTLREADSALGPAPLVADEAYARQVAGLHLYLRQHHGLRDVAKIGREIVAAPRAAW